MPLVGAPVLLAVVVAGGDYVIVPKVEVIRRAQGLGPLCAKSDQLMALVSDAVWDVEGPHFGLDALEELADLLVGRYLT